MAEDQDWCVQCGENDEHSLRARASWYSAGALVAASAVLASGAAAAGVAALNQGSDKEPPHTPLIAQVPNNSVVTTTSAAPVNPGTPETLKTPHGNTSTAPLLTETSSSSTATPAPAQPASTETSSSRTESTTTTTSAAPEPIELQAQDLSVYNPNKTYPPTAIGDPRKNFEEGATTLWSVNVEPPSATELNVGLLVHRSTPQPVGTLEVITSTPGYTLEVLGTKANKPPGAITASAWKPLGVQAKIKRKSTLKLSYSKERFNYIVLWIRKLPTSSPPLDHVTIDEVALFPSGSSGS